MINPDLRQRLVSALKLGASSEVLLSLVEEMQVSGQTFGEIEGWLRGLACSGLPPEAIARLEAFLDQDFNSATELIAEGVRYWDFLHHRHGEEVGFGESVSLKAIGRPGYGLFFSCRPGEYPELEPLRVDDEYILLGSDGRLRLGDAELAALRKWHQQIPLFEESGGRRAIDQLTRSLREAPPSAFSVSKVSTEPDVWRLSVGGRWRDVAVRAAKALGHEGAGGSLARLGSGAAPPAGSPAPRSARSRGQGPIRPAEAGFRSARPGPGEDSRAPKRRKPHQPTG